MREAKLDSMPKRTPEHAELDVPAVLEAAALNALVNAILIADRSGKILWVNAAFAALTGYGREEAVGQHTRILKSGRHPEAFYRQLWETVLSGQTWCGEIVNRRKDGSLYDEDMTIAPIRDARGEIAHFVAMKENATERKTARDQVYLLGQALAGSSELIGAADQHGLLTFCNRALQQTLGYSESEILGKHFGLLLSAHNPPGLNEEIAAKLYQGDGWSGECLVPRADGTDTAVFLNASQIRDAEGALVGVLGMAQDITQRKRAEREILFKTALLEAQTEATIDGILAVDESDKVILSNRQFAAMWGVPPDLIRVGEDRHLLHFVSEQVEDPRRFMERVESLYSHRQERSRDEIKLNDGRIFDRYSAPLIDSAGKYRGRIWYFRDITEAIRASEKHRASEEQFRQLAENIHEIFFILTPDPVRMEYISPAYDEIWGRPHTELYSRVESWIDSVHPEDRERVGAFFGRCMAGIEGQIEYRIVRPDGSIRWIDARSFPVRDAEGKLLRVVGIAEDVTARKQKEAALAEAHDQLNAALAVSKRQAEDAVRLTELVDILQSCQTVTEAYKVAETVLQKLLPSRCGALCVTSPSRNVVEAVTTWGQPLSTEKTFAPEDCWALRRGKVHCVDAVASPLRCAHITGAAGGGHICVPLAAQGETIGVLYLECEGPCADQNADRPGSAAPESESRVNLAQRAAVAGERLSLAIANLQLREVLRRQSIRDPLTGLYNRRYMEESLERELRRASRAGDPAAVLMLDIDHFKQFNDTFGHQAGDALLRGFGEFLNQRSRAQDVACRYGGEEFALILSGASAEAAMRRANLLREDLRSLSVQHAGELLRQVTVSVGIAIFPAHGPGAAEMLQAADRALYRAKSEGRDRAVLF